MSEDASKITMDLDKYYLGIAYASGVIDAKTAGMVEQGGIYRGKALRAAYQKGYSTGKATRNKNLSVRVIPERESYTVGEICAALGLDELWVRGLFELPIYDHNPELQVPGEKIAEVVRKLSEQNPLGQVWRVLTGLLIS